MWHHRESKPHLPSCKPVPQPTAPPTLLLWHTNYFLVCEKFIAYSVQFLFTVYHIRLSLTPYSRVLLEKLTDFQLVKKFPAFYGTRKFITVLTSARHLSLSWANSIQPAQPLPTSSRSILILSSHLRLGLPTGLFPSGFAPKSCAHLSLPPYVPHAPPISFFSILSPAKYWVRSTDH